MKNILGLIPARGGSKSIPRKNIIITAGKPLLSYTCIAALKCDFLTRILLSTDDREIAEVGKGYGIEVPFLRPAELAKDDTPSIDVALHAINWLKRSDNWIPDIIVLLQPTSPLRRSEHIDEAIDLFMQSNSDTVVSVVKVPHRFSPYNILSLKDNILHEFWKESVTFDRFRRQELPVLYARNGPAVLITRVSVLKEQRSFYGDRVTPYFMSEQDSVDIDTLEDLKLVEWRLMNRKGGI